MTTPQLRALLRRGARLIERANKRGALKAIDAAKGAMWCAQVRKALAWPKAARRGK
jgi:hypothetical protein